MSSNVQQFQLSFNAAEDRLLLTITTGNFQEFRFWLTRRITKGFWLMLQKLQEMMLKEPEQEREEIKQSSQQIYKETQKPEAAKFATRVTQCPLGETPLLLHSFSGRVDEQDHVFFHFQNLEGLGIDFAGEGILVTILLQLLRKAVAQAEWGIAEIG